MKKVLALSVFAVLGVAALSSCKKDYTCECTVSGVTVSQDYPGLSKSEAKDAETACTASSSCSWSKK